jgi:hypothetical protein
MPKIQDKSNRDFPSCYSSRPTYSKKHIQYLRRRYFDDEGMGLQNGNLIRGMLF